MHISGENIIGFDIASNPDKVVQVMDPANRVFLPEKFSLAKDEDVDKALNLAKSAFAEYKSMSGARKAEFLRAIADEIMALGDTLIHRAMAESGLPEARFKGERGRTVGQLRLFADLVAEGSWVRATIDYGNPDRTPMPKPDVRTMMVPMGPVLVFTASNFPLAFSTAGGDTASALAAGNPVIVKAHEAHLGTNELVSKAIQTAAKKTNMPDGVYSSLTGQGFELGQTLVKHPVIKGVAFTGSHRGGLALHKIAQERKEPIPVFAEMGSINPMFVLPSALKSNHKLPSIIAGSVNMGMGQFCTNPGIIVTEKGAACEAFKDALQMEFSQLGAYTMLTEGIHKNFEALKNKALATQGVNTEFSAIPEDDTWKGRAAVASVDASTFIQNPELHAEVFGPFTMVVECEGLEEMEQVAESFEGQLTSTIWGEATDFGAYGGVIDNIGQRAGRLIFNQVPTGVEVCHSMHHGGPFPAATDSRFTSVGTRSIDRFVRPKCFQNWPDSSLPPELQNANPLGIRREEYR